MTLDDMSQLLWQAAAEGKIEIIKDLLSSREPPDINLVGTGDRTLLQIACHKGHLKVVEYLVEQGADLTHVDERGYLAIHEACQSTNRSNRLAIMRVLLNQNPEMINETSWHRQETCLHLAAQQGDGQLIRWLLDQNADPSIRNFFDHTAWDFTNIGSRLARIEALGAFVAFALKEDEIEFPESDAAVCKLGEWKGTCLYWCPRASRRDMCVFLESVSAEHDSLSQVSPRINTELCAHRTTKTGLRYREPAYIFKHRLSKKRQSGIRRIRTDDVDPDLPEFVPIRVDTGNESIAWGTTFNETSPITASDPLTGEPLDQRKRPSDLDYTTVVPQLISERTQSQERIRQLVPDYFSLVIPYFSIGKSYILHNRNNEENAQADFCIGHQSDSFGMFEALTLDEHCYPALPEKALRRRNEDQTISRLYPREQDKILMPLVMIGQTWIWKTPDALIGTELRDGTASNFRRIIQKMIKNKAPDVFVGVAKLFSELVDRIETQQYGKDTILDIYGTDIVNVQEEVEEYLKKPGVENMGIDEEKKFLHRIKDARDELTMIRRVLTQQEELWGDFASNIWPGIWAKSQEGQKPYYIDPSDPSSSEEERRLMRMVLRPNLQIQKARRRVEELNEDADRVERSIVTQLDLKAKHASLNESHATAVMSAAIFGFTVITIVFTPLSFVTSLFALPIQTFQQSQIPSVWAGDAGMYPRSYIGKWVAIAEVVSVSLTIVASWLALEFGLRFRITSRMFGPLLRSIRSLVRVMVCLYIRNTIGLVLRSKPTAHLWRRLMMLWTRRLKFKKGYEKRYIEEVTWGLLIISPTDIGLRRQLGLICAINESYLLEESLSEKTESEVNGKLETRRRHRWRRWRNADADEENGELEDIE